MDEEIHDDEGLVADDADANDDDLRVDDADDATLLPVLTPLTPAVVVADNVRPCA